MDCYVGYPRGNYNMKNRRKICTKSQMCKAEKNQIPEIIRVLVSFDIMKNGYDPHSRRMPLSYSKSRIFKPDPLFAPRQFQR